jgi:hypothetical protein
MYFAMGRKIMWAVLAIAKGRISCDAKLASSSVYHFLLNYEKMLSEQGEVLNKGLTRLR